MEYPVRPRGFPPVEGTVRRANYSSLQDALDIITKLVRKQPSSKTVRPELRAQTGITGKVSAMCVREMRKFGFLEVFKCLALSDGISQLQPLSSAPRHTLP